MRRQPQTRLLVVLGLAGAMGNGLILPFLYVYLSEVRHLAPAWSGLVAGWIGLSGLVLAIPTGALADRIGSRRALLAVAAVLAVGFAAFGQVHTSWQAIGVGTLLGLGGAPLIGVWNTVLSGAVPVADRQLMFGLLFAVNNLGVAIGGVVGGLIADVHAPASFEVLYGGAGAAFLLIAVLIVRGGQAVAAEARAAPGGARSASHADRSGYRVVLADRLFRRFLGVVAILMASAYAQLNFGFGAFAVHEGGVSTHVLGWAFAANCLTIVCTQATTSRRAEGVSRTWILALASLVISASWVLLALGVALRDTTEQFVVVGAIGCSVVFALGEVLMAPVLPALTNSLASDAERGRYNVAASMMYSANDVIGPAVTGVLIGAGLAGVWVVLVVGGPLLAAVLALRLRRDLTPQIDGIATESPAAETT